MLDACSPFPGGPPATHAARVAASRQLPSSRAAADQFSSGALKSAAPPVASSWLFRKLDPQALYSTPTLPTTHPPSTLSPLPPLPPRVAIATIMSTSTMSSHSTVIIPAVRAGPAARGQKHHLRDLGVRFRLTASPLAIWIALSPSRPPFARNSGRLRRSSPSSPAYEDDGAAGRLGGSQIAAGGPAWARELSRHPV